MKKDNKVAQGINCAINKIKGGDVMKQQLGLQYSESNAPSVIIINRLVQLQQHYGGTELAMGIFRMNAGKKAHLQEWRKLELDRHLGNLAETYGRQLVYDNYYLVYGKVG